MIWKRKEKPQPVLGDELDFLDKIPGDVPVEAVTDFTGRLAAAAARLPERLEDQALQEALEYRRLKKIRKELIGAISAHPLYLELQEFAVDTSWTELWFPAMLKSLNLSNVAEEELPPRNRLLWRRQKKKNSERLITPEVKPPLSPEEFIAAYSDDFLKALFKEKDIDPELLKIVVENYLFCVMARSLGAYIRSSSDGRQYCLHGRNLLTSQGLLNIEIPEEQKTEALFQATARLESALEVNINLRRATRFPRIEINLFPDYQSTTFSITAFFDPRRNAITYSYYQYVPSRIDDENYRFRYFDSKEELQNFISETLVRRGFQL